MSPTSDDLAQRCLMLGDDALVYSHRLQQWLTRAPELEEETALANIALDLLGQARMLLGLAGTALDTDEDRLAFFREEHEFRNVRLVERADRDFAELVGRLFIFATWRHALLDRLRASTDAELAAIAAKGAIELAYHRDYAAAWIRRLGDGTPVSHERMQAALEVIWPFVDELFRPGPLLAATDDLRSEVDAVVDAVLAEATLRRPESSPPDDGPGGRDGVHTQQLSEVLTELQSVARAHPLGKW